MDKHFTFDHPALGGVTGTKLVYIERTCQIRVYKKLSGIRILMYYIWQEESHENH